MTWARINVGMCRHPKVVDCTNDAKVLYLSSILYSVEYGTDGRLRRKAVAVLLGGAAAGWDAVGELVAAKLWTQDGEEFVVHDFLDYQPSAAELQEKQEHISAIRSAAGQRGAEARWNGKNGKTDGTCHPPSHEQDDGKTMPTLRYVTGPDDTETKRDPSRATDPSRARAHRPADADALPREAALPATAHDARALAEAEQVAHALGLDTLTESDRRTIIDTIARMPQVHPVDAAADWVTWWGAQQRKAATRGQTLRPKDPLQGWVGTMTRAHDVGRFPRGEHVEAGRVAPAAGPDTERVIRQFQRRMASQAPHGPDEQVSS